MMSKKQSTDQTSFVTPIRFAGFSDARERCQLGAVVDVQGGRVYKHLDSGNIPVYGTGGYMLSVSKAYSYTRDAVGIGRKATIDKPFLRKAPFGTVDALFYAVARKGANLDFVFDIFQIIDRKKMDESTGVPSLSITAINEVADSMPSAKEQCQIGCFFRAISHLITFHRHKLEKLLNIKKVCLEKMFV